MRAGGEGEGDWSLTMSLEGVETLGMEEGLLAFRRCAGEVAESCMRLGGDVTNLSKSRVVEGPK